MPPGGQVRAVVPLLDLIGGEVPDPLSLKAEQQDEAARSADVGGQGVIGQAAVQQLPAFVVAEQVRWLLARDKRDGELAGEPALGGPCQEVADTVAALGVLLIQPAVQFVFAQLAQGDALLVEPGRSSRATRTRRRRSRPAEAG